ncbi:SIMPL domain-containing protein [Amorphus orientalis]|uniref:Uncharacterized protein YggE n=1 Tax=Amorphus orientalis TaxID=649198 RepID=A0AAE3VL92_9HYPH|nr:SIMPL domain-containing protein [Amorphus orientalis]MDQ0314090.1 uncharacterized protein YggE [Amorphus orientalis]
MRLALVAVLAAALATTAGLPARADDPARMTVTGYGEAAGKPDMATVRLGTVSEADEAADALEENSRNVQSVVDAIKQAGIEARDIQTSGFSVSPRYVNRENETGAPTIDGYRVSNTITARVRDLDKLGTLLDTLVKAGANDIGGIQFEITDTSKLEDTARIAAIADARHKAEIFAEAAGVELGQVRSIDEGGAGSPRPQPMMRMEAMSASSVPVEAGEQTISAQVRMVFEIEPTEE